ncbi:MAG: peptidoglycan DD-metalloendopeptidase family protein [Arenicellales bacterium]
MTDRESRACGRASVARRGRWFTAAAVLLLCCVPCAAQVTLDSVPGGLTEIPLGPLDRPRPSAYFGEKRILVMPFAKQWVGLVGLPLTLVPGDFVIQAHLEKGGDAITRQFTVYPRRLGKQTVVAVPASPLDNPEIPFKWRDALDAKLPLQAPVAVPAEPLFGRYRQVSGAQSSYVSFVSFHIRSDVSVKAPGDGRVAAVKVHGPGAYVWIDHGMSLYSCVGPVLRPPLHEGDAVKAGQSIGRVVVETADKPSTIFWAVYLNGAAVDPFLVSSMEKARLSTPGNGTGPG